ncbi:MAG TPA: LysM domain-containing protein [Planctomycetes bacterium]|nr:LysM domain-containing protein [Planctomycetota bacterium]HIN81287.1 LysM domain-containing protein [Planctomycetota bacterium]
MTRIPLALLAAVALMAGCGGTPERTVDGVRPGVVVHTGRVHRVLPGETVAAISHEEGVPVEVIHNLNPGLGDGPLPVGTAVRLPMGKPEIRRIEVDGSRPR